MAQSGTLTSGVAMRYASALFDLAREENAVDDVARDMETVRGLLDESADLRRLVRSPVFSADEQVRALGAVLDRAGIGRLASNFLKLAARNRRLFAVPEMIRAFGQLVSAWRGEEIAEVSSAEPLSEAHLDALRQALSEKSGGTIRLSTHVDPSLIGGLVVRLGSRMIDTSLRTKLNGLRSVMKEAQ